MGLAQRTPAFPRRVFSDSHRPLCVEQALKNYFTKEIIKVPRDLHLTHGHQLLWGTLGVGVSISPSDFLRLFQTNL